MLCKSINAYQIPFFKYLASLLRPFLVRFQTSKPMVPSLGTELDVTTRQLISLIVRRKVVAEAGTPYILMKMDLEKKENLVHLNNVEIGSAVTSVLVKMSVKDEVKMKFRKD